MKKQIIHYRVTKKFKGVDRFYKPCWHVNLVYICNTAVLANMQKSTKIGNKVTCKNCLRALKKR